MRETMTRNTRVSKCIPHYGEIYAYAAERNQAPTRTDRACPGVRCS